jgi:hypothetical protein
MKRKLPTALDHFSAVFFVKEMGFCDWKSRSEDGVCANLQLDGRNALGFLDFFLGLMQKPGTATRWSMSATWICAKFYLGRDICCLWQRAQYGSRQHLRTKPAGNHAHAHTIVLGRITTLGSTSMASGEGLLVGLGPHYSREALVQSLWAILDDVSKLNDFLACICRVYVLSRTNTNVAKVDSSRTVRSLDGLT